MVGSDMSTLQSLIDRLEELVIEKKEQEAKEADNVSDENTITDDTNSIDMQAVNETE